MCTPLTFICRWRYAYLTGRKESPWSQGVMRNCYNFFFNDRTNWATVFTLPGETDTLKV
jgi:hypothetical protein